MLTSKFTLIMDFVDNIHNQMLKTKKSKISIKLPSYIKTDEFMKYVNDNSSSFKYTVENGIVTCEFIPENSDLDLYLKNNIKHMLKELIHPKDNEREEVDEAGRKFLAEYYVDNPAEFTMLLQNMFEYKAQKFSKEYNERRAKFEENIKFIKSTEVFGEQGGGSDVYEFGYYCQ